jgi:MAF protein
MTDQRFILASQSPRRRQLLALLGYPFEVVVPDVDEDVHLNAGPATYVLRTAQQKAEAAGRMRPSSHLARPHPIVIAADTTVALDGAILGKPADGDEARRMLLALRGRAHDVHTGVCLVDAAGGREVAAVHSTVVTMRDYGAAEIDAYVATGDPLDKAGAYAIQHGDFSPVAALDGCYLTVVGLSLCGLIALLRELGVPCRASRAALLAAHDGFPCPLFEQIQDDCR